MCECRKFSLIQPQSQLNLIHMFKAFWLYIKPEWSITYNLPHVHALHGTNQGSAEKETRNILDCDQSNVLLAHYFQFSAKSLKFCRRIWQTSFNNSALKTFARRKYLGYISDTSRVITNVDPHFVAMATRVGRGRIWLTSFNSPTPKTPC